MTKEEWIEFGLANNNMLFVSSDDLQQNDNEDSILLEKENSKRIEKIKETITTFMIENIDCFNYLKEIGFTLIDDYFDNSYQKNINIKKLIKNMDNYVLYVDVSVDYKLNGVCYLELNVEENNNSFGYVFSNPTIEKLEETFSDITKKCNKQDFIKPMI